MSETVLIAGLGNPGPDYARTRHNAGFMLVERLGALWNASFRIDRTFRAEMAEVRQGSFRVLLVRPLTYMNASGESLISVSKFFKVKPSGIFVVVDDVELPLGTIRLRPAGSAGGHRGLESIEKHLGTREYPRQKLGVARPPGAGQDLVDHVLGRFRPEELPLWELVLDRATRQIESWLADGLAKAMSLYNGPVDTSGR